MPAILKKSSFTRSFSKKWNSVTGKNNSSKIIVDGTPAIVESDEDDSTKVKTNFDGYGSTVQPSPLDMLKEKMSTPSPYYEGPPEAAVISDTSSDDDSSGDEQDAAEKYGYGDASPDAEATQTMPRRLSSRANAGRRRSSITRQIPLNLSGDDDSDDENLPFHPRRTPRRSSLKGSGTIRAPRRASIGTCQERRTSSIEEDLASGVLAKSQVIEVKLPMRRESIKRRRSICFDEDVYVRKIQPTTSVKGAEKKELWFQDDEYYTIKKKTRALIDKVDSNGIVNGKKYCTRGLEKYMEDPRKRAQEKYQAWDSVLMEQEMQRKLTIYDDESIGRFYKRTSITSAAEAHSRATADAAEVASFYEQKVQTPQKSQPPQEVSDNEQQQQQEPQRRRRGRRASIA